MILSNERLTKALIRLCGCAGWSAPLLFTNPLGSIFFPLKVSPRIKDIEKPTKLNYCTPICQSNKTAKF